MVAVVAMGYLQARDAWHLLTSALMHFVPLGFGAINAIKSTLTRVCNLHSSSVDGVFHE